jgi:hypothetical protein
MYEDESTYQFYSMCRTKKGNSEMIVSHYNFAHMAWLRNMEIGFYKTSHVVRITEPFVLGEIEIGIIQKFTLLHPLINIVTESMHLKISHSV